MKRVLSPSFHFSEIIAVQKSASLNWLFIQNMKGLFLKSAIFIAVSAFALMPIKAIAQSLELTATSDKTDILTGETLVYTFKYKCASTTMNCTNVTLVANVPSGIVFPYQTIGLPTDISSYTISPDFSTITFVFKEPLMAGNTGIIQVTGQGSFGLKDGTPVTMTANLLTGTTVGSTANINTTLHSYDKFCPQITNVTGLALDNPSTYSLSLSPSTQNYYGQNGIGLTNPGPVTVVQQFPTGTNIQSVTAIAQDGQPNPVIPSGACVIDNPNAKVTCTFPASTMQVNSGNAPRIGINVSVIYPSSNFSVGSSISDVATVTYQPEGSASPITLTTGNTRTFTDGNSYASPSTYNCTTYLTDTKTLAAPISQLKLTKQYDQTVKPGQNYGYDFVISNSGNTTLTDVVVEDIIPTGAIVTQVYSPGYLVGFVGDEVIKKYVKTVNNPIYTEIPQGSNYNVPTGDVLTAVKYTFDKIPAGAVNQYIGLAAQLDPNSTAPSFQNCLTGTASNSGFILDPTSKLCATTTVGQLDPYSSLRAHKWITQYENNQYGSFYGTPVNPGTSFWNFILLDNMGGGLPLQNPVAMDLLPLGLDYNNNITYYPGTPTADVTDIIPNFNGTGRTLVRLRWNSPMPANSTYGFNIAVKVNVLAPAGLASAYSEVQQKFSPYTEIGGIKNTVFFTGSSPSQCFVPTYFTLSQFAAQDIYDLNSNGSTTDSLCYASDYVGVTSSAQMSSVKWVKGQCDADFTKYPAFGQTVAGGIANYKLIITNTGNVATKDVQILDILPFVGDAGVIDPNGRLTQWRPNLVTPLQTPAGVTVYYSTSANPCRTDYVTAGPAGCTPANWTSILPQDPTTIQSLKLDFGTKVLKPGDQVELMWDMRAPVTGVTTGDIAWNSFGFKSTRADNNDPFLPSEPFKVGIKLKDNIPGNYGDFVWLDANKNGIQDNGEVGVDGVHVELHKDNGDGINDPKTDPVVAFTATGNGGQYLFPTLPVGDYYAVFFLPPGYGTSPSNATTDDKDSDGSPSLCNGNRVTITPITTISSGETDLTWDQGIYPDKAAVGNYVWFDENQNNVQDESSANGLNGVVVCLYKSDNTLVARDTTANDIYGRPGYYLFDQLDAGSYYVQFKPTPDKTYTPNSGAIGGSTSDQTDSDVDPNTGKTATFTLAAGQVDLTWDAGMIIQTGIYKLGNFVWNDANNNGIFDTGELGINNVTVNLYNDRNNDGTPQYDEFISTTLTGIVGGINGIYVFDRLPAGNYIVQIPDQNFSSILKDFSSSVGNDPAPDPDDNVENEDNGTAVANYGVISQPITLGSNAEPLDLGTTNYSVDFGFYKCDKPTATVSITQANCSGGTGSITIANVVGGDKVSYSTGTSYTGVNYASATTVSSLTGGLIVGSLANPITDQYYTVRIFNSSDACFKDTILILQNQVCCMLPSGITLTQTAPTCTNGTGNNNGKITVTAASNSDKYGISTGATYTGVAYTSATAFTPSVDVQTAIPNAGATYTIRFFNGSDACYKDTTVVLNPSVCPQCSITGTFTQNACNNNSTTATTTDDYFTVTVSAVSATNGGTSGKYQVVLNGTVLNTGGTAYGTSVTVGTTTTFKADGATTYQLTVRDLDNPTCESAIFTTTATANCSTILCPPRICVPVAVSRNN